MGWEQVLLPGSSSGVQAQYNIVKWVYCVLFLATVIATWVIRDYADLAFANTLSSFDYCKGSSAKALCGGKQVAVRISFGNCIFFVTHVAALFNLKREDDLRAGWHSGLWFWKLTSWLGILIAMFVIPVEVLNVYGQIARVGSGFFLVFQVIELINFFYIINEYLLEKEGKWTWACLIGGSALSVCLGIAMIIVAYYFFAPNPGCHLNLFFVTFTIAVGLLFIAVLFIPNRAESAGLLTSATVWAYCTYVLNNALNSEPDDSLCVRSKGSGNDWITVVGFILALLAVSYTTLSISTSDIAGSMDEGQGFLPYRADFFHLIFALGSMYIAMLFTNWEISTSTKQFQIDKGWTSTWVKIGSQWLCEGLYLWTVIAPAVLRHRYFE